MSSPWPAGWAVCSHGSPAAGPFLFAAGNAASGFVCEREGGGGVSAGGVLPRLLGRRPVPLCTASGIVCVWEGGGSLGRWSASTAPRPSASASAARRADQPRPPTDPPPISSLSAPRPLLTRAHPPRGELATPAHRPPSLTSLPLPFPELGEMCACALACACIRVCARARVPLPCASAPRRAGCRPTGHPPPPPCPNPTPSLVRACVVVVVGRQVLNRGALDDCVCLYVCLR